MGYIYWLPQKKSKQKTSFLMDTLKVSYFILTLLWTLIVDSVCQARMDRLFICFGNKHTWTYVGKLLV